MEETVCFGLNEFPDDFAIFHGAETWKHLDDVVNWKPGVQGKTLDPDQKILLNQDGVDAWSGISCAITGRG